MKDFEKSKMLYRYVSLELRHVRKSKNLTLDQVANDLDLSQSFVSRIERGKRELHAFYYYLALAEYYDVDIKEVISNAELRMEIEKTLEE